MAETMAWLMELDGQMRAAVGELEMVHVIQAPELFQVPLSPPYCGHVALWQEHILPLMDLPAWLNNRPERVEHTVAGIFAYQARAGEVPHYGALSLAATPLRISVNDELSCALPPQPPGWKRLALSCFTFNGQAVPILNLAVIFSGAFASTSPEKA